MNNQKLHMLVVAAHPDDAEIGMGGTIAKHTGAGHAVGICDLTEAEMSSNGTVELRQQEASRASEVLNIQFRRNLKLPDRGLKLVSEQTDRLVEVIRQTKPDVVFAPYWNDRHPDHIMCSKFVEEAVFNAKLRNYMPHLPAHQVGQMYYYFINDLAPADLVVDITEVYSQKQAALLAYESQFTASTKSNDYVETPLNQNYLTRVEARDALLGQAGQVQYAEGFVTKQPYIVDLF